MGIFVLQGQVHGHSSNDFTDGEWAKVGRKLRTGHMLNVTTVNVM